MNAAGVGARSAARAPVLRRARAAALLGLARLAGRLPASLADGVADAVGEAWYRLAPDRAAIARGNLAHVVEWLAAQERGSARARAAAGDPARLERLVRAAFRHNVRTYAEWLRGAAYAREARRLLVNRASEATAAALAAGGPAVWITAHFGSLAAVSAVLADGARAPIVVPMEELADPELQRAVVRLRSWEGARIIGIREARREIRAALARGEIAGFVADRDISGGGIEVPLFGLPAPLPVGPALLALEAGAPLHVAAAHRARDGRLDGGLVTLPHPPADLPRRARVEALIAAEAAAFEAFIERAPEQWWAVFYPIWPAVGPRARRPAPPAARDGAR